MARSRSSAARITSSSRTEPPGWIAAVAFGSSFVVGVVSGVVPARRAAALDPVDALRYE